MTFRECAIVEAYTGYCMLTGDKTKYVYEYLQELLGRPVWTHELANPKMQSIIHEKSKPDFMNLCARATEDKE